MTPALRTYHRWFWFIATPVLCGLFALAIRAIPTHTNDDLHHLPENPVLPTLLRMGSSHGLTAKLYTNDAHDLQLEIGVITPLAIPEALVYIGTEGQDQVHTILAGKLSSRGVYRFPLPPTLDISSIQAEVYDPLHQRTHCTIKLTSEQ